MANLISEAERDSYQASIDDVHDTFGRDITVWRSSAQEITSTEEEFDAFSDRGIQNVIYTPESKVFKARVKYIDRQEKEFGLALADASMRANASIEITQEFQIVRIKVDAEANDYIKDCEKITIDGMDYIPITVPRPHGVFEPDYFTLYLRSGP